MADLEQDKFKAERAACREFDAQLADYLEGEDRTGVSGHAKECPFCSVVLADIEQLRAGGRALGWEDPPARVWANVRAQLAAEGMLREPVAGWLSWLPRHGWMRFAAPVGTVACLALVAATLLVPPPASVPGGISETPGKIAMASLKVPTADEDSALAQTVSDLEKTYAAREMSIEPAVKATYKKSLDSLDASIRECAKSMQTEPNNSLAREYLLAAYTQKAEVLETALEFEGR